MSQKSALKNESKMKVSSNSTITRLESIRNVHNAYEKRGGYDDNNRTDRMEDYLEVIYGLIQQKGYATAIDISNYLNMSPPSVKDGTN